MSNMRKTVFHPMTGAVASSSPSGSSARPMSSPILSAYTPGLMHEQGPHCPKRFAIPRKTVQGDGRGHFAKLFIVVQHAFAILVRSEHRIHAILRFGEKDISGKGKQQTSLPHIACLAVKFFDTILEHGSSRSLKPSWRRPEADGPIREMARSCR